MLVLFAVACALAGCGGDDGGGTGGSENADSTGSTDVFAAPAVKLPGPCTTDYADAKGKITHHYVIYKYDAKGRLTETWTQPVAETLQTATWKHTWQYDASGRATVESYRTTRSEPDFDWAYTYDAAGRRIAQKGFESPWNRAACKFEYLDPKKRLTARICDWEVDHYDDDQVFQYTQKSRHYIVYTYGEKQLTEEYSNEGATAPDTVITRIYDDQGRVIRVESDWSKRGYSEHTVTHKYDAKGNLTVTEIDDGGDEKINSRTVRKYDSVGNELTVAFDLSADGQANYTWVHDYSCWLK